MGKLRGLLDGAHRPYFGAGFLVPLGLILVACGAIFHYGHQVAASIERGANDSAAAQGAATAREIGAFLRREHERLGAFVDEKRDAIAGIIASPDDWHAIAAMQASVKRFFPGAFAFTVTDGVGMPVFEDFDGLVGDACRQSLQDYAESTDRGEVPTPVPPVHPIPDAYHFDLITRLDIPGASRGLFFVSLRPGRIAELISAAEQASGMAMWLVKRTDPTLIEISGQGARDRLTGGMRLDPATWDRPHFAVDIPGTHWRLVALPDLAMLDASVAAVYAKVGLLAAALLSISIALLFMIRRAERRDNRLFLSSLQASLGRQRAILQSMADALVAVDGQGRILDANNAVAATFGYPARDVIGRDLTLLVPGARVSRDATGVQVAVGRNAHGQRAGAVEVTGRRRDGEPFPALLTVGESDEGGRPIFVCILHDLSDVRAAERKIDAQARTIRRSFHELEAITRPASNDIELPLRRMAALGESLGDGQRGALARYASLQFDRFAGDWGRADPIEHPRGQGPGDAPEGFSASVEVDLDETVRDVATDFSEKLAQVGGELTWSDLPSVVGDPRALRQLFWNLLDNAIKFRDSTRPLRIVVAGSAPSAGRPGDVSTVVVSVRDNGIGFDPADGATVFEPFARLHPRGRYPGNGLGLFFCRRIVNGMGGTLTASSVPGEGSQFQVVLPALAPTGKA